MNIDTIGNAIAKTWNKAQKDNDFNSWNRAYNTIRGMWLLTLYSDHNSGWELEEYTNMLLDIAAKNKQAAAHRELEEKYS